MKKMRILSGIILFVIATSIFITSCTPDETNPINATNLELLSGDAQIADAGTILAKPIEVLVKDQNGKPFAGATVNFSVEEGSVSKASVTTDANGKASVTWTLGSDKSTQKLMVSTFKADGVTYVAGSPLFVTANLEADKIELVTGGDQTGLAESKLKQAIELMVKYPNGDAFTAGTTVYFAVSEGSVSETSAITDENGTVRTEWTVGTTVGTQTLSITAFKEDGTTALASSPLTVSASILSNKITDYDGNIYKIVEIGEQIWMKENLKVTHYADGTVIPHITDNTEWANLGDNDTDKAYCYYNNNANGEKDTYGALYTWAAAMNGAGSSAAVPSGVQGICPTGWHLPSIPEWRELQIFIGMSESDAMINGWRGTDQGGKLKETGTTHWNEPNTGATNEFGFSALPGGFRMYDDGSFTSLRDDGTWTSSSAIYSETITVRSLIFDTAQMGNFGAYKSTGFSVRCVKD